MGLFMLHRGVEINNVIVTDVQTRNFIKAVDRSRKYVARLNYFHFSQFPETLETISLATYNEIVLSSTYHPNL